MIKLLSLQANNFKQLQDVNLRFPACGSVLIEGRNEAGKSTLFEAIFFALFGKPLLAGTTVEDLIGYESKETLVLLEVTIPGGRFLINRKVKRSKTRASAEARLRVYGEDGAEGEEVRGSSAVNERIQQELKLDADAFLNSCFVEQKKLEKLEGMTAADREKSLMRLLNMDRMLDDERNLRITLDDSRRLQRLEQRVRLAEVMAEIPGVRKRGNETKIALDIIAVKDRIAAIEACRSTIAGADARLAALLEPIKDIEERIRRIEAVKAAAAGAEIIGVRIGAVEQQARDIARLRQQLAELERVAAEELPVLRDRLARTKRLRGRWSRLIALEADAARTDAEADTVKSRLRDVDAARKSIEDMQSRIQAEAARIGALEAEERQLAVADRALSIRQALEDWQAAATARDSVQEITRQTSEARAVVEAAERNVLAAALAVSLARRSVTNAQYRSMAPLSGIVIFLLLARTSSVALVMYGAVALLALLTLALELDRRKRVAVLGRAEDEETRLSGGLRDAQNALVRLEGQMENARATSGAAAGRLEQAALKLESLTEVIPGSVDDAAQRLAAMPVYDEPGDPTRLPQVRRELAQVQGAIEEQNRAIAVQRAAVDASNVTVLKVSADRLESRVARIRETILDPWAESARERSASLGLDAFEDPAANREAASAAEAALTEQIRLTERGLTERPAIQRRIAETDAAIGLEQAEMTVAWPPIASVRPGAALPNTSAAAGTMRSDLSAELDALDEPTVRGELRTRREERNAAENDRTVGRREASAAEDELRRRADALKYPPDAPLVPDALSEALPGWDSADPARRAELEAEFDELKDRNAALIGRRDDLATALGLDPKTEKLDPDKERAQRDDVAHDQGVREKAILILRSARERIMGKVLPYTIEHMRRILPALTMERYHDAKLTSDYKIEVWDERASMWKAKNIFSGGTRDQFSLALRLAFAVATLPQERGAAPGFIFLDEPLSSFDVERSAALMYLLTKGEIAETFDQILVISHSQSIAADDFQYRLRMDGGRIVELGDEMRGTPAQMELAASEEPAS